LLRDVMTGEENTLVVDVEDAGRFEVSKPQT
jgi:hypothetical protein